MILCSLAISRGLIIEPPAFMVRLGDAITDFVQKRTAALAGAQR